MNCLPISGLPAGPEKKKNARSFIKERFLIEKKNEKKNGTKKKNKKRTSFLKVLPPFSSSIGMCEALLLQIVLPFTVRRKKQVFKNYLKKKNYWKKYKVNKLKKSARAERARMENPMKVQYLIFKNHTSSLVHGQYDPEQNGPGRNGQKFGKIGQNGSQAVYRGPTKFLELFQKLYSKF